MKNQMICLRNPFFSKDRFFFFFFPISGKKVGLKMIAALASVFVFVADVSAQSCGTPAPGVTNPVNYCKGATASQLSATGTNLLWSTVSPGSVGGTTTLTTAAYTDNSSNNKKTNFTTNAANITISSVDYFIPAYQSVLSGFRLSIYNSAGTIIATSSTATTQTAGSTAVKITNVFNYNIVAAGNYSIGVSAGRGNIGSDNPSFPITEATGMVNITGVSYTGARCFNNIIFTGTTSSVAPTPSTTVTGSVNYFVTQTVAGCTSAPATITVNVTSPNISQVPASGRIGYYRFEGNANDEGLTNNGTLQNAPTAVADRFGIAGKAYSFNGSTQYVTTANSYTNPNNFTVSVWFKTTSVTGGKLIGFGVAQTGSSGQYDRHLYMNNAGQLYFGVYPGTVKTINSSASYNDDKWHLATATLSSAGMILYADGAQIAADPATTTGENYTGYWRIGFDNNNAWTSQPSSFYFAGSLDDAIIYNRALTAAEITQLYISPDGAGNNGPVCSGSSVTLSGTTLSGATYAWTGPNSFTSAAQNPSFTYTPAAAGTYTLNVTVSGCQSTAYTSMVSTTTTGQWGGNISTDWADAANWCSGTVPLSTTNVTIAAGAARMPVISTTASCNNLTISSGATVTTSAAGTLNIAGTLANAGTMVNSGTTNFNGTSGQQTFSGVTTFNNLSLNNSNGLLLPAGLTITGNVLLTAGILNVNNYNLTVGGSWTNNVSVSALTAGTGTVNFNSAAPQTIGGTFKTVFNNLQIASTGTTVTLTGNTDVTGNLSVTAGTFDLSTFTANRTTAGGTLTVANNAVLKIGGTGTYPSNYSTNTLVVASTVEYAGTAQTVSNKLYGNLKLSSSSGAAVKTFPATAFTILGNLTSVQGAGTSVTYSAAADITVSGNVSIGAATVFNSATFTENIGGNWANAGTFNGNTGKVIFTNSGSAVSGAGAQNFNDLTIAASMITFSNENINVSGNLATTGSGSFSQASGGTLFMTGSGKTISGSDIFLDNLNVSGSVTTSSFKSTGNIIVSGSLGASSGIITLSGNSKTISGAGTIGFYVLSVTGSYTTAGNFSVGAAMIVAGSFSASAGTATFTGTSSLSGTANLYNTTINGTSLQLSANAVLGVANLLTITAGVLNVTASAPNTVNFNGSGAQNINAVTYDNLILSNGNNKSAIAAITVNGDLTIGTGTTFIPGSFTHSIYKNWTNNGTFTAGTGTIQFLGTATTFITGATTFNILTIDGASSTVSIVLQSDITAATVNMTQGIVTTGSNTLTITTTRTGNGIIIGNIKRTHAFTTGVSYAFEGPDNTINFSSVTGVTSITVSVSQLAITDFPFGGSINRQYNIVVPSGTYNAALRLHYEDNELNGGDESTMALWNYSGAAWVAVGKTSNSTTSNYVEQTSLTNITNRWTCSDNQNVVQWNGSISTDWNTAANWTVLQGSASAPPSATDIVNLGTAAFTNQPAISNNVTVKNINFGSTQQVILSMNTGGTLTTGGIHGTWSSVVAHSINVNGQTVNINGDLTLSDGAAGHSIDLSIGTGTIVITDNLIQSGGAAINFSGAGTMQLGGDYNYTSGSFTPGTGTVIYNGADNQLLGNVAYNNVVINKAGGIALMDNPLAIAGDLSVNAGQLDNNNVVTIGGNVSIASGVIFHNYNELHVHGNWSNAGTYVPTVSHIYFDGTGAQSIASSSFNNLHFNKTSGTATLTGNITVTGDLTGTAGTLDMQQYTCNRNVPGGAATLSGTATIIIGANNAPMNFASYSLSATSTVIFNGTGVQTLVLPGFSFGNLIFRNSGPKSLSYPITVNGDLTIESGSSFNGGANNITLNGNWINQGTYVPSASTLTLNGVAKTITGVTTFNNVTIPGSYTELSNITYNGLLHITASGSISGGLTVLTTLNGDLINSGILYALGTTTFTGNTVQTLSLINSVQTVARIVNFNGSVSPVLHSTSAPLFGYLNINNTGGVDPSVGWTILNDLTIGSGASFNGGPSTHAVYGSLTNNGTVTGNGILNFLPSTSVTLALGTGFSSTGKVVFGGSGAATITGTAGSLANVEISNTNAAGISPSSAWNMTGDFKINSGATFKAGLYAYTVGGKMTNAGTFNAGTSGFTFNGTGVQELMCADAFNNLAVNKTAGSLFLSANATAGTLNFISGNINTESYKVIIPAAGTVTNAAANTGWVSGRLQKAFTSGTLNQLFETGDDTHYTPALIEFDQVTTPGDLTVSATGSDHPQISNSTVNPNKDANRYWTISNAGVGFTKYNATLNFVASDVDAGATPSAFDVAVNTGSAWTVAAVTAANATNIKALDVTATGDFAVGEICNKTTAISYAGSPYCANAGTANPTITGNGGGSFSGDAGLVIDPVTGVIDLAASTPGDHIVTYELTAAGGCPEFNTKANVTISLPPSAVISYSGTGFCTGGTTAFATLTGNTGGTFSSTAGLSINATTGNITLSTSTVGTYTVTYSIAAASGCGVFSTTASVIIEEPGTWTGAVSTDWNDPLNWRCEIIPSASDNIIIPAGLSVYPVISATSSLHDILIASGASVTVTGTLKIAGTITATGVINATAGTVEMNGLTAQTIPAGAFYDNTILNLIVSNNVTLAGGDTITGALSFGGSNRTFATAGFLTLKSSASSTARIADITNAGTVSGNTITGKINIERYLYAKRAWRFIATPVNTVTSPTITEAWREGGITSSTGYGTQITGPAGSVGMDAASISPSMKSYDMNADAWIAVQNTGAKIANTDGYMIFVRGDRSVTPAGSTTATCLRIKGDVLTGDQSFTVNAGKWRTFGNPYASSVDMRTISKTNIANSVTVWNPNSIGAYNSGAYETYVFDGADYRKVPGGAVRNYIESGEAVFVQSNSASSGSVTVKETDKAAENSLVSRQEPSSSRQWQSGQHVLELNLYATNPDGSMYLADGVLQSFDPAYSAAIDNMDARKSVNVADNLSIKKGAIALVAESRPLLQSTDTLQLSITGIRTASYFFRVIPTNINPGNLAAFIEDSYLNTQTPVSLTDSSDVHFAITADAASRAANRFRIIFKTFTVLPVKLLSLSAKRNTNKTVTVTWVTENETDLRNYEIQRSADAVRFESAGTRLPVSTGAAGAVYNFPDNNAGTGKIFYRIKSNSNNGNSEYSNIVSVAALKEQAVMNIYPQVLTGDNVLITLNVPAGNYSLQLYNIEGKLIVKQDLLYRGSESINFKVPAGLASGAYQITVTGENIKNTKQIIKP
jgi:hypothetical protein